MTSANPARHALERQLARALDRRRAADEEVAEIRAALNGEAPVLFTVAVKTAAEVWNVTENAALRRARKLKPAGLADKLHDGRWYIAEAAFAAGKVRMRPLKTQDAVR